MPVWRLYQPKTKEDISNPYNKFSHDELLELANVEKFENRYNVVTLENGRILVLPKK